MNTYARWAVAAIAVVLAIGGAAYFLAPAGGQVGGRRPIATVAVSDRSATRRPRRLPSASAAVLASRGLRLPGNVCSSLRPGADIHDRPRGPAQLRTRLRRAAAASMPTSPAGSVSSSACPGSRCTSCASTRSTTRPTRGGDRSAGRPRGVDRKPARRDRRRPEGRPGGWPRRDPTRCPDRRSRTDLRPDPGRRPIPGWDLAPTGRSGCSSCRSMAARFSSSCTQKMAR